MYDGRPFLTNKIMQKNYDAWLFLSDIHDILYLSVGSEKRYLWEF